MKTGPIDFMPARLLVQRFMRDKSGATVVEYGMIVAVLSVVLIATFGAIGETTRDDVFGAVSRTLEAVLAESGSGGDGS